MPITFRGWSYFMNCRVIVVIKVLAASKFRSDWCYKIQIRKNDLLQKSENLTLIAFFARNPYKNPKFSSVWC